MPDLSALLSRKFLAFVLVAVFGTFFVEPESTATFAFLAALYAAYVGGNVTESALSPDVTKVTKTSTETDDMSKTETKTETPTPEPTPIS